MRQIYVIVIIFIVAFCFYRLGELSNPHHDPSTLSTNITFPRILCRGCHQQLAIYTYQWEVQNPKGVIFISHGFGEHAERYLHVVEQFNKEGYSVYSLDHIGHGRSDGERAHIERFEEYWENVLNYVDVIMQRRQLSNVPKFLLGHSMGGLIAIHTALASQNFWNGVVISGPALSIPNDFLQMFSRVVSKFLPKLQVPILRIHPNLLTKDESRYESYAVDPLVYHGSFRALWGYNIIQSMKIAMSKANTAKFPFLLVHGEDDVICLPDDSQTFYNLASSSDKQIIRYPGLKHEVMNEIEKDVVIADIINWMNKRI